MQDILEFGSYYHPKVTLVKNQTESEIIKFDCALGNGNLTYVGDAQINITKKDSKSVDDVATRDCMVFYTTSLSMPSETLWSTIKVSPRINVKLDLYSLVWKCDDGRILKVKTAVDYKSGKPIDTIEATYHQNKSAVISFEGKGTYKGHMAYIGDLKVIFGN